MKALDNLGNLVQTLNQISLKQRAPVILLWQKGVSRPHSRKKPRQLAEDVPVGEMEDWGQQVSWTCRPTYGLHLSAEVFLLAILDDRNLTQFKGYATQFSTYLDSV